MCPSDNKEMKVDNTSTEVFLGLGGNIGDPIKAMSEALSALEARHDTEVLSVSSVYQTPPWGPIAQDDFLNAVAHCKTSLAPQALLDACLQTEETLKRVRRVRWGPRTIDIDVLIYGDREIETETLTVPHPRMLERAFVMVPFSEIAPDFMLQQKSALEWSKALDQSDITQMALPKTWWQI